MNELQTIARRLKGADGVLIGASNGLSISEGYHIFADNDWFRETFGDFREKYGLRNILEGMFQQFSSREEYWGFWSRLAWDRRWSQTPTEMMRQLYAMVRSKPYFVLTSNGEDHFTPAGFDRERVFEMEGTFARCQCEKGCGQEPWYNGEAVAAMARAEKDGRVPTELLPRCPRCGGPATVDVGGGQAYAGTPFWQKKAQAFQAFVEELHGKNLVILELGIGWRNQMIKAPLMNLTAQEPNAFYATFNKGEVYIPDQIAAKSVGVDGNLAEAIAGIAREMGL